ncbi:hypothetical protein D3C75_925870 [compost metagenome]
MKDAIFELIVINALRATHRNKVNEIFYINQDSYYSGINVSGTVEELLKLQKQESYIMNRELEWNKRFSNISIPEYISVKEYAEYIGCSIWKIYRELKKNNIVANKVKGRWRIYLQIDSMEMVA